MKKNNHNYQNLSLSVEDRYKILFKNIIDAVIIVDMYGNVRDVNLVACRLFGYSKKEFLLLNIKKIHPLSNLKETLALFKKLTVKANNKLLYVDILTKNKKIIKANLKVKKFILNGRVYLLGVFRDMTEQKKNEQKLIDSELRYRQLFENFQGGIMLVNIKTGKIIKANPFLISLLGYTEKNILKKYFWEIGWPKDYVKMKRKFRELRYKKYLKCGELYLRTKIEKDCVAELISTVYEINGVQVAQCNIKDITIRKQLEMNLIKEKNRLKEYLDVAGVILLIIDKNQKVIEINEKGCNLLGYFKKDIVGKNWFNNFIPKKDRQKTKKTYIKIIKGIVRGSEYFENSILTKDKGERIIAWHNKAIKDKNGKIILSISSGEDITNRILYEEKIKNSEKRYSKLVENSSDGVVVIQDGLVKFVNKAIKEITGYSSKEVSGKPLLDFIGDKYKKIISENYARRIKSLSVENRYEFEIVKKNGIFITVESNNSLIDFNDRPAVLAIIRDVSRAKEIDKIKSEFISVASHQLRSPLTGIKWFCQLLIEGKVGELSEKQIDFLKQIYVSNERMIRLVNDLLNVSHIETGQKFIIEKNKNNIILLINNVIKEQKSIFNYKKIIIKLDNRCSERLFFSFDYDKIFQVFSNLINNSIKYSDDGKKVLVGVKCFKDHVDFFVRDWGYGISDYQKKRVFEKFFRGDNVIDKSTDGTGLGLYIAKSIIEAHGGKIWFESEENKGTIFYFSLPFSKRIV